MDRHESVCYLYNIDVDFSKFILEGCHNCSNKWSVLSGNILSNATTY
jgi:hypothetical protein